MYWRHKNRRPASAERPNISIIPQMLGKVVVKDFAFLLDILRIYNSKQMEYIVDTSKNKQKTTW